MSERPKPNLGLDLRRIHHAITRGLAVAQENCQAFDENGLPDDTSREGFWKYCHGLEANAHGHHVIEDDLFFPFLRERPAGIEFAELMAEYQQMQGIPDETQAAQPAPLAVPFLLYNVQADDRAHHLAAMPPEVTQQLVPVVWNEEWAPMKPSLLD